ncbi:hypothetical protein FJT64_026266 [Amphibalanus amphitrite]|uniref:Uncharacterized protein n=1 Tax=Amphibalanus amphitrite TaxID=1232801 RepID=A0A6A4W2E2_AMPAM|nr:hypothetical protein FJT64_026266 [Amphibalanus amphitrite]
MEVVKVLQDKASLRSRAAVTPKLKSAMGEASGVILKFIRGSPKRSAMSEKEQEQAQACSCKTRWTCTIDHDLHFMHDMGRRPATLQQAAKMLPELEDLIPEATQLVQLAQ